MADPLVFDRQIPDDPRMGRVPVRPLAPTSAIGAFARHALRSTAPTAGGVAAFSAGAEIGGSIGAGAGPIGAGIGAVGSGLLFSIGGATAVERAQNWVLDHLDGDTLHQLGLDEETRANDEASHPRASFLGGLAPQALFLRPSLSSVRAAAGGAAIGAGVEAGVELQDNGRIDPFKVAAQAVGGALLNKPTRVGEFVQAPGERMARTIVQGHGLTLPLAGADDAVAGMPVDRAPEEMTADEAAAGVVHEDDAHVRAASPFVDDAAGARAHGARLTEATRAAAQGRAPEFSGLQAPQSALAAVKAQIAHHESRGSYTAQNPVSTASGRYQFTDGTWLGFGKRLFAGRSDAEIMGLKRDPAAQERVMDAALADYAGTLRKAGQPATAGNLYLLHFLGPDAVKVLRAAGDRPVSELLPAKVIESNPTILRGKSAGDVIAEMARRMGDERAGAAHVELAEADLPPEALPVAEEPRPILRERAAADDIVEKIPGSFRKGPADLIAWLAEQGGLRDDEGHGLVDHMGLQTKVRGVGDLIRPDGLSIDRARELAAEAGYFHNMGTEGAIGETTERDFIDLLAEAKERKIYTTADMAEIADRDGQAQAREENARFEARAHDELDAALEDWRASGLPAELSKHERRWAMNQIAAGADAHSAIEHTWSTAAETIAEAYGVKPGAVRPKAKAAGKETGVDDFDPFGQDVPRNVSRETSAAASEALKAFDVPGGEGARRMADSIVHDLRMLVGAPLKATVKPDAVDGEAMLGSIYLKPKGKPGFHIEDESGDGHVLLSVFRDEDGIAKGVVRYPATEDGRHPVPGYDVGITTFVDPAYRRQGIATKLYDQLRDAGHDIDGLSGTEDLTPDGAAFVTARRGKAADAALTYRIEEDGEERLVSDWLAEIDADKDALDQVRACAAPGPGTSLVLGEAAA